MLTLSVVRREVWVIRLSNASHAGHDRQNVVYVVIVTTTSSECRLMAVVEWRRVVNVDVLMLVGSTVGLADVSRCW